MTDKRPEAVNRKCRVGDFEVDTIIGKNHNGAIVSIVDRKSKLTFLAKVLRNTAQNVADALVLFLNKIKQYVHTITSDNGTEFAYHKQVAKKLGIKFYFADPYSPWQRGLNENTNGLCRQYVPKGSSFEFITDNDIFTIMSKLNSRPRKSLEFKTPAQVFFEETGVVIG
ncbi:IS30 family transposase [Candidatus Babeliales bacterium]|nr:IS30 family transposase [Candidatus Babeliales bacterium]